MGYYVRVFCTSAKVPTIRVLLNWAKLQGYSMSLDEYSQNLDIDSETWEAAGLVYKEGKLPILSEVNRDDGRDDCLLREEIGEFTDFVGDAGFLDLKKKKVIKHLKSTRYIVANQLPTSDIDDDGFDANWVFLDYFVQHCGGIVQADGEGFYNGNQLFVPLE